MPKTHFEKVVGYLLLDTAFKQQITDKREDLGTPPGVCSPNILFVGLPQKKKPSEKNPTWI